MRDAPPHVLRLNPQFLLKPRGHFIVDRRREKTKVAGYQIKLSFSVIQRDDAVIDLIVHPGGLALVVTHQPLRCVGRDIGLDD
jgi:hypothetical protein